MRERALASFRQPPNRYNCAQSVLVAAIGTVPSVTQETVDEHARCGGGRCPEGTCGALWVSRNLVQSDEDKREIEAEFLAKAGSTACREILKKKQMSCHACVATAAEFLARKFAAEPAANEKEQAWASSP